MPLLDSTKSSALSPCTQHKHICEVKVLGLQSVAAHLVQNRQVLVDDPVKTNISALVFNMADVYLVT
jgi:hypothetical protein